MIEYIVKVFAGKTEWRWNGKLHRLDGPAVEYAKGGKYWFLNGKRHREDGPACEYYDGKRKWFLNGKEYSEEGFLKEMQKRSPSCAGKVIEIDGKKYKLTEV